MNRLNNENKNAVTNFFFDWKLKEYLNIRGVDHKLRSYYLFLSKLFFEDMDSLLENFDEVE